MIFRSVNGCVRNYCYIFEKEVSCMFYNIMTVGFILSLVLIIILLLCLIIRYAHSKTKESK